MKVLADLWLYSADVQVYYSDTLKFSVTDTGLEYWGQKAPTAPGNPSTFLRIDEVGQQYYSAIDINDITGLDNRINELGADTLASVSVNSTDAAKSLYTMSSGVAVEFRRSAGSTLLYLDETNGRIGIGTNAPARQLQVGDVAVTGTIGRGNGWGNNSNSSYATLELYNTGTGVTTLNNNAFDIHLQTKANTRLFIHRDGDVGIGTTSPSAKLDVVGTLQFATGNQGNNKVLFSDAQGNADWQDPLADGNPVKDNFLTGSTWNAATRELTLTRTGSLPDVTETLSHTHPWSEITDAPSFSATLAAVSAASTDATASTYTITSNVPVAFKRGTNSTLFISGTSDRVGINTATPNTALEVAGTLRFVTGNHGEGKFLRSTSLGYADWAAIDYSEITNTPTITNYTFSNGLTESAGAVKLGGTLTQNTLINDPTNTYAHRVTVGTDPYSTILVEPFGITLEVDDTSTPLTSTISMQTSTGLMITSAMGTGQTSGIALGGPAWQANATSGDDYSQITAYSNTLLSEIYNSGVTTYTDLIPAGFKIGKGANSQTIIPGAGTWSMTLPANAGTNGYVLKTNGSGVTSWGQVAYSDVTGTPTIPDNYVSGVSLVGNLLTFTGVGSAFNSTVDLSTYATGGESLSATLAIGNTTGNYAILANKDYGYILTNGASQSYKIYAPAGPMYINSDSNNGGQGIEISVTGAAQSSAAITLTTNSNIVAVNDSNKVKIVSGNALSLKANGGANPNVLLSTSLITTSEKTFEFPDWSGTISTIDRIGGKPTNSNITSPGAGENGYVIQWDNALGQYKLVAGGGGSDGNDYVNAASFNTGTGVLTLTRTDTGTVTVDLDGRYLESETPQNLFETISKVADSGFTWGTSDIVADSATDTLKLVAGTGIAIDTDATGDAIRIRNTQSTGLTNAYTQMKTGGTTIFATGADVFQFRSSDSSINFTIAGNDPTYGDNLDLTIASVAWSLVTSTPTTLSGYGITDAYTQTQLQTSGQSSVHWGNLTNVPTYDNYGGWTISDGTNSEQISSGNTLTFAATGDASVTYDTGTNTMTIGLTGGGGNDYVDSATFSTTTGVLTLGRTGILSDLTVDLDDRWSLIGHSHSSTDITDWAEAVDDRVGSLLVAGSNITLDYNDVANTLTISATGGGTYTAGTGLALNGSEFSNTDLGSAQNIFKNIANSAGTTQFSAASNTDTIRFAGSGASSVAFDAGTKTVTVSSTDTTYGAANGLTLNSGNFELGGTITKNTTIDGGFQMYYGSGTKLSGFRVYTTNDIFLNTDGGLTLNLSDSLSQIELSAGASDVYVSGNIVSISGTDTRIPYGAGTAAGKLLQTTNINGTVDGTPYAFPTSTGTDGQILKLSSGNLVWAADDGGGGGATAFTGLTDTPSAYTGAGLQFVRVNSGATALEFVNADTLYSDIDHTHTFAEITSKPTTISGYGISDALIFKTINRATDSGFTWGTSDVVAASTTDTLKVVGGTGIAIATDATNKAVKFSLSAGLNDLSDVNTSGLTSGASLVYNGTNWSPSVITIPSATVPTETGYSGTTITLTAGGTISAGDLVAINVSGQAVRASAGSATKTGPAVGYATSSVTSSQSLVVLVDGFIYKSAHGLTTGSVLYVGTTAGASVHTAPSGSGDLVQVVGVVINSNVILARLTLNVIELT